MAMIRVVQEPPNSDRCPWCGVTLGEPRRGTRRQIVLSARPGLFCWRCPDCGGVWAVRSVRHAPDEDEPAPVRHRQPASSAAPDRGRSGTTVGRR